MAAPRERAVSVRWHSDDRRTGYFDIFANPDGDTNVVYLKPHIPIAWHRHQKQADRIFLVRGILRLRVWTNDPVRDLIEHILVDTRGERSVVHIPAKAWHGYEGLTDDTIILQFNGPDKWDGSDEERKSLEEVPWEWL